MYLVHIICSIYYKFGLRQSFDPCILEMHWSFMIDINNGEDWPNLKIFGSGIEGIVLFYAHCVVFFFQTQI
jgi:hypothetical protein